MKWTSLTQVIPRQFSRIVGWLVLALTPGILQGSIDLNRLVPADSPAEYVEWVRALEQDSSWDSVHDILEGHPGVGQLLDGRVLTLGLKKGSLFRYKI